MFWGLGLREAPRGHTCGHGRGLAILCRRDSRTERGDCNESNQDAGLQFGFGRSSVLEQSIAGVRGSMTVALSFSNLISPLAWR